MESIQRLMEIAIERIAAGGAPPAVAIPEPAVPEGEQVMPHVPINYRIPADFPNPPPGSPLNDIQGVRFVLTQCGMTGEQITRLIGTEVNRLEDLAAISESDVEEQIKILARTQGEERVVPGLGVGSKVKAVVTLLHELKLSGDGILNAYDISIPRLQEWQMESNIIIEGDDKITVSLPDNFDYKHWVSFKDRMVNYFRQTMGARKIPLFYVIRGERPTGKLSFLEERIWNASLSGPEFERDNARVFQQLVQKFRDTDGWAYVAETEAMQNHGRASVTTTTGHMLLKGVCHKQIKTYKISVTDRKPSFR